MTCPGCGSPHEHDCPYCGRAPEEPKARKVAPLCAHHWVLNDRKMERFCTKCGLVSDDRSAYTINDVRRELRRQGHESIAELI